MPLPLRQLRAIFSRGRALRSRMSSGFQALRQGAQEASQIKQGFVAAKVRRIQNYGQVEQMGMHAKTLLAKHANLASKRGGSRLTKSLARQNQYVRHVQTTMQSTLKAHKATGPYGKLLINQVKTAKKLVRRTK